MAALSNRLGLKDRDFIHFLTCLLEYEPRLRPSAHDMLNHPFLKATVTSFSLSLSLSLFLPSLFLFLLYKHTHTPTLSHYTNNILNHLCLLGAESASAPGAL